MAQTVTVQKVPNEPYYGITDGKKWFFYCYRTRVAADAVIRACNSFDEPQVFMTNISYERPYCISDFEG